MDWWHFGSNWRNADVSCVDHLNLSKNEVHLMYAPVFGLFGALGLCHSWITWHSADYDVFVVAEITDGETLMTQGASLLYKTQPTQKYKQLMISNRCPTQRWFGGVPKVWDSKPLDPSTVKRIVKTYPCRHKPFSVTETNCNRFASWAQHQLDMKPLKTLNFLGATSWTTV